MTAPYVIPNELQDALGALETQLGPFLTQERLTRLRQVVSSRTRRVLCVFESTNHSHNISAVMRTIDAFGFQDIFFVYTDLENTRFRVKDSVERGSADWLTVRRSSNIEETARFLKTNGYKILLVSLPSFERTSEFFQRNLPHFCVSENKDSEVQQLLQEDPIALVFGNEKYGVHSQWTSFADGYISVGMHGFVESLNLSVCAGILLHELRKHLEVAFCKNREANLLLSDVEKNLVMETWLSRDLLSAPDILRRKAPHLLNYLSFLREGRYFRPFDPFKR